jgi:hypothetical protein
MNLSEFNQVLVAKYPQAEARRTREVGGTSVKNGLAVTFTPDGKIYECQGSFYAIAQQLGLIEKWYILENGGVVDQATSEEEANEKMCIKVTQAIKSANEWGDGTIGKFTIRRVN